MAGSDEDRGNSTGDGQAQIGYSVARRSGGRVTRCAVCTVNVEMRSAGFLVEL
jgi:hypothetical protein